MDNLAPPPRGIKTEPKLVGEGADNLVAERLCTLNTCDSRVLTYGVVPMKVIVATFEEVRPYPLPYGYL